MAESTAIEWADSTWNPIRARRKANGKVGWHCEHVSEGCRNCYAEKINLRLGTGLPFKPGHRQDVDIFVDEKMLEMPTRWRKPRRIFVESMSDGAADFVTDAMLDAMLKEMSCNDRHTFIVLTKRPERLHTYLKRFKPSPQWDGWISRDGVVSNDVPRGEPMFSPDRWPLRNVWIGTSVEDQAAAEARIPVLLDTPAARRFLSIEPLLGPVDLTGFDLPGGYHECFPLAVPASRLEPGEPEFPKIDWVIVGGESGPKARPMHPDWVRSLRDQCAAAGVPFFFKQWGAWAPDRMLDNGTKRGIIMKVDGSRASAGDLPAMMDGTFDFSGYQHFSAIGKKAAGRLLDGVEHNAFPPAIAPGAAA